MNIKMLVPFPTEREPFKRSSTRFIPEKCGCYVLTTFEGAVLYIGLTDNLRRRVNQHLDNEKKIAVTPLGRASFVHWLECSDTFTVERTWLNIHEQHEAKLPILNFAHSPIFT